MISKYAPIVIFAFNRLYSLKHTIASLLENAEAKESDLFIYVDGARVKRNGEEQKVCAVQEYVKRIYGFQSLTYKLSNKNKGLGPSVIEGVTEIINKYGRVIVIEDDLVVNPNFLSYMNQSLNLYEHERRVFSICGYSNKVRCPKNYVYNTYFCHRSSSWGWGTWKDRWSSVDWELEPFENYVSHKNAFNKWGGSDCFGMLKGWHEGKNKSWAIRFCFAQFLQNGVSLFPIRSFVRNYGFDGSGTNCHSWSRFKCDLDNTQKKIFVFPNEVCVNEKLLKSALSYHSLFKRIFSKLMYFLYR